MKNLVKLMYQRGALSFDKFFSLSLVLIVYLNYGNGILIT